MNNRSELIHPMNPQQCVSVPNGPPRNWLEEPETKRTRNRRLDAEPLQGSAVGALDVIPWGPDESRHWIQWEALGASIETVSTTRWPDPGGEYFAARRVSAG